MNETSTNVEGEPLSYPTQCTQSSDEPSSLVPGLVIETPTCTQSSDEPSSLVPGLVIETPTCTQSSDEPSSLVPGLVIETPTCTQSSDEPSSLVPGLVIETPTQCTQSSDEPSSLVPGLVIETPTCTQSSDEPSSLVPGLVIETPTCTQSSDEPSSLVPGLVNETSTNVKGEPLSYPVNVTPTCTQSSDEPSSLVPGLVIETSSTNVAREPLLQAPDVATPSLEPRETLHHSFMDIHGHSESTPMVQFVDQIDVLKCDSSGMEFTNTDHDITLRVPEGAIPDGVTVHIKAGVALHGPFLFPPGTRPISPIVWFCMQEGIPFLKPVEVILPHFLHNWKNLQLGFLKADHSTYTTDDGEKRYMFRPVNDTMEFHFENGRGFGVLSTKHFCSLCIHTSNITRDQLISEAQYCLTEVIPDPWPAMPIDVPLHFCVTFFLKTCFEVV